MLKGSVSYWGERAYLSYLNLYLFKGKEESHAFCGRPEMTFHLLRYL
jgi:hypothetical protein